MKRKKFSKEFKAKVAIEAIKGQRPLNEIAQEFSVHPTQINRWKKELLESAPEMFSKNKDQEAKRVEMQRDQLYRKVGQLQIEVDWLKKSSGIWTDGHRKARHGRTRSSKIEYSKPMRTAWFVPGQLLSSASGRNRQEFGIDAIN